MDSYVSAIALSADNKELPMQYHSIAAAVVSLGIVIHFYRMPPPDRYQQAKDTSLVKGLWLSTQFSKVDPTDRR